MKNFRDDIIFVQQGSSNSYRARNEQEFYVLREQWLGSELIGVSCQGRFADENQAKALVKELRDGC